MGQARRSDGSAPLRDVFDLGPLGALDVDESLVPKIAELALRQKGLALFGVAILQSRRNSDSL